MTHLLDVSNQICNCLFDPTKTKFIVMGDLDLSKFAFDPEALAEAGIDLKSSEYTAIVRWRGTW